MDYEPESQGLMLTNYTAMKPGATYTATVPKATSVTDEVGNEVEAEVQWAFTIEGDTSPPALDISSPADASTVSGLVDVIGTISDETLMSYVLEIGEGASPSSWIELASGGYVEMVGDIIALWDTTAQTNGLHTLRLVATDEFSHTVQDAITVSILNGVKSPTMLYINPSEGLEGIETEVEIVGTNFSNSASVLFDLVPAVDVVWVSNTQLNAKVPGVLVPGLYDVTVDNGGGATAILPDGFSVIADTSMQIYLPLILKDAGSVTYPLLNGDFESGQTAWTEYSLHGYDLIVQDSALPSGVLPHSGAWATWLAGAFDEVSYIEQQVTVSSPDAYLGFWYWIGSEDTCGNDFGSVYINGSMENEFDLCVAENTGGWAFKTVDLSAFADTTVMLQIRAEANGALNSNLFIDDVGFQASPDMIVPDLSDFDPPIDAAVRKPEE